MELGTHPSFGARPLRRVIQEHLEDQLADVILEDPTVKELVAVLEDGQITIKSVQAQSISNK